MPDTTSLLLFMSAAIALLLIPGPAVLFVVARSIEQGRTAGLVSVLGISLGTTVHITAAALGLSALLLASATAFTVVKYAGAIYLIFLGIQALRQPVQTTDLAQIEPQKLSRILMQGFIVNALNPKTALFFLAFLPQFVTPERGTVALQVLFLGLVFTVLALFSDSAFALVAGTARDYIAGNEKLARFQKNFAGVIYIGLGISTAVSGSK